MNTQGILVLRILGLAQLLVHNRKLGYFTDSRHVCLNKLKELKERYNYYKIYVWQKELCEKIFFVFVQV